MTKKPDHTGDHENTKHPEKTEAAAAKERVKAAKEADAATKEKYVGHDDGEKHEHYSSNIDASTDKVAKVCTKHGEDPHDLLEGPGEDGLTGAGNPDTTKTLKIDEKLPHHKAVAKALKEAGVDHEINGNILTVYGQDGSVSDINIADGGSATQSALASHGIKLG